jgi:hypothetical protein
MRMGLGFQSLAPKAAQKSFTGANTQAKPAAGGMVSTMRGAAKPRPVPMAQGLASKFRR